MDRDKMQEEIDEVVIMCKQMGLDRFDALKIAIFYSTQRIEMDEWEDVEPLWERTVELARKIGFTSKFGEICLN